MQVCTTRLLQCLLDALVNAGLSKMLVTASSGSFFGSQSGSLSSIAGNLILLGQGKISLGFCFGVLTIGSWSQIGAGLRSSKPDDDPYNISHKVP